MSKKIRLSIIVLIIIMVILFGFLFVRKAISDRNCFYSIYDKGIELYISGDYIEAMELFGYLKDIGLCE